jgi:hypothetical protein
MTARVPEAVSVIAPISGGATADPNRLYVSAHSAGDHLAAMGLSLAEVRGGIPISVIFDLEPIRLNYLNEKLGLDRGKPNAIVPTGICRRTRVNWPRPAAPGNCPSCAGSRSNMPRRGPRGVCQGACCRWTAPTTSRYSMRWRDRRAS